EGSKPAAVMADWLSLQFREMGLEPVDGGDPEVAAILEETGDPVAAARSLRAAFVITGSIASHVVALPVTDGGYHEARVDGRIAVHHVDAEEALVVFPVETFAGSKSATRVQEMFARSAARQILGPALAAVFGHPSVRGLLEGSDPKVIDALTPGKNFVAAFRRHRDQATADYDELAKRQNAVPTLTLHSPGNAQDRLLGVTASELVVATSDVRPYLSPRSLETRRSSSLEALVLRPLAPEVPPARATLGDRRLWRGYQAFTYPSVARDGRTMAVVENLYGYARTLALVDADGGLSRLRVEPKRHLSEPRLAPSARSVAFVDRPCKRCDDEIAVVSVPEGKERFRLQKRDYARLETFTWAGDDRLLVLFAPAVDDAATDAPPLMTLWAVDVTAEGSPKRALWTAADATDALTSPVATPDGGRIAISRHHAGIIVVVAPNGGDDPQTHAIDGKASSLAISPDGRFIAYERRGDVRGHKDLRMLDTRTGEARVVADTPFSERNPVFSPDGKRLYFELRADDPVFRGRRELIRIASVALP
ncbi:MAG: hypothetical protein AAGN82_13110, partial [Myxococcota bacterium]